MDDTMMKRKAILAFGLNLLVSPTLAGGLYLYEIGGEDVGLANAGMAARAQDAATIFSNPAGMTRLHGDQASTGLQLLAGNASYALNDSSLLKGESPGNVMAPFPSASLFYSHSIDDRLKIGVGTFGNFGLSLHYGDWAGDSLVKDATLVSLTVQPTLAYRIDEHWSLGVGIGINYGYFALNRETAGGEQKNEDHDWALSARLGLMHEFSKETRLGLMYASKTEYEYNVNPAATLQYTFHPLPGAPGITISKDFTLPLSGLVNTPQQLMLSAYHRLAPQWALLGNLGWQDWSRYAESSISISGNELAGNDRLRDTWHGALGMQHDYSPSLRLNAGVAYDSSYYKSQEDASLTVPSGAAWRFGFGAQYALGKHSSIGSAFEYLRMQGSDVQSAVLGGSYDTNHLYFLTGNYSYRF